MENTLSTVSPDDLSAQVAKLPVSIGANYTIKRKRGEGWIAIGIRERIGHDALTLANPGGLRARTLLIPGRRQMTADVHDGLVVNLPEMMVYQWAQGSAVNRYPIAIGRVTARWHTPVGQLKVVGKARHPAWHRPEWAGGGVMPAGPNNPLGDRWIGLSRSGYGLHGTSQPGSIGRTVSHGCMRLFPPHIRELFDRVAVNQPVIITYETLTVGYQNGMVYLSVFPDVYARGTNTPEQARKRLAAYSLEQVLTPEELQVWLTRADGISRPILGSTRAVVLNGQSLSLPIGPTLRNGRAYLPFRPIAEALGATVKWDAAARKISITRGEKTTMISLTDSETFNALGTVFVPVRLLTEQLGGTAEAVGDRITLTIP